MRNISLHMIIFLYFEKFRRSKNLYLANRGFFDQKDNRAPPLPPTLGFLQKLSIFAKIRRDWPRDLKFGMWHPSTFLSSGKIRNPPPDPPFPVIFNFCKKPQKFYISIFGQKESKKGMVPLNKNCREGPHLVDEKKFQPDRMKGLEVMRFLKPQILILSKISTISVNMQFR